MRLRKARVQDSVRGRSDALYANMQKRFQEMKDEFDSDVTDAWGDLSPLPVSSGESSGGATGAPFVSSTQDVTSSISLNKGGH